MAGHPPEPCLIQPSLLGGYLTLPKEYEQVGREEVLGPPVESVTLDYLISSLPPSLPRTEQAVIIKMDIQARM